MRQQERFNSQQVAIEAALAGWQTHIWTALPGIVQSYDATKQTVTVQPAIKSWCTLLNGQNGWLTLPVLPDVPVVFPSGGGFAMTFPIAAGDECLLIFSSRCIDNWWQAGGVQAQAELRSHDLGDAFAIIGPRSQPNMLPSVSTTTVQVRSADGSTYVEIASGHVVNVKAPGGINLTGPVAIDGDVSITGKATATGEVQGNGIKLSTHTHSGVQAGGGTSGPPVP